jgi:hypothetical protein
LQSLPQALAVTDHVPVLVAENETVPGVDVYEFVCLEEILQRVDLAVEFGKLNYNTLLMRFHINTPF